MPRRVVVRWLVTLRRLFWSMVSRRQRWVLLVLMAIRLRLGLRRWLLGTRIRRCLLWRRCR